MSFICGIYDPRGKTTSNAACCRKMSDSICAELFYSKVSLGSGEAEILKISHAARQYAIVFDGKLYNEDYIKKQLTHRGVKLIENSHRELVLYSYIIWREKCLEHIDGAFAFCVYEIDSARLFFARDKFGIKPFYYSIKNNTLYFASDIKALLSSGGARAKVDMTGLCQLFAFTPCSFDSSTVFCDIKALPPAFFGVFDMSGLKTRCCYGLSTSACTDSINDICAKIRYHLEANVQKCVNQMKESCVLLSGGLSSSVIASMSYLACREKGENLFTYSFEYQNSHSHFVPCELYNSQDDDFAVYMAKWLGTQHMVASCNAEALEKALYDSVDALGCPSAGDIDAGLYCLFNGVSRQHNCVLCGLGANELFGGYPWHTNSQQMGFGWLHDPNCKMRIFRQDACRAQECLEYLGEMYKKEKVYCLEKFGFDYARCNAYFDIKYYLQQNIRAFEAMSRANGVELEYPFLNRMLLEYAFNLPYEYKCDGTSNKTALRRAAESYVPERILNRQASPFPKSFDPAFYERVKTRICEKLQGDSILCELCDVEVLMDFMESGNDCIWYGQSMGKTQLLSWLLQLDHWCVKYNVDITAC